MIRRLLAATGVITALLGATFVTTPLATAAAAGPTQVALVVDYPDGTSRQFCVEYRAGMSGADVLAAAGPTYGTGPYAGFVLRIGGQGTVPPTTSTYWAYWTTVNGGLVYSSSGVTSTHPRAGTVEAWHWNSSSSGGTPTGGSYASLCPGGFATPAPATTPPAPGGGAGTPATGGGTTATGGGAPAAGGTSGTGEPGTGPSATTTATTGPAAPGTTGTAPTTPGASAAPTGTGSTGSTSRAPTSVAASDVAAVSRDGLGGGATVGLLVAAAAVVAFAVLAVLARRRRLDQD